MFNSGTTLFLLSLLLIVCETLSLPAHRASQTLLLPDPDALSGRKVPGDSPVQFCGGMDPKENIFAVDRVDLHPNPPKRGSYFTIDIRGTFKEATGAVPKFTLNATYGDVHSIDTVEYLCDHMDVIQNQTQVCPPKQGKAILTTTLYINELMMPPGNYTEKIDAYTEGGTRIFCFFAAVSLE